MNLKNTTILALGMFTAQLSFAQNDFSFGLKTATNIGWFANTNKTVKNDGIKLGFAYGIMGDYYFRSNYAISGELLLSTIKTKLALLTPQTYVSDGTNTPVTDMVYETKLQYLELPISIKLKTKDIGNIAYWGNFGFSPGLLVGARGTQYGSNIPQSIVDQDPTNFRMNDKEGDAFITNEFEDRVFLFRLPLIIGGGVEYKMAGSTSLQAGVRIANNFTDVFTKDKTVLAKNNYVAISLGVLF